MGGGEADEAVVRVARAPLVAERPVVHDPLDDPGRQRRRALVDDRAQRALLPQGRVEADRCCCVVW